EAMERFVRAPIFSKERLLPLTTRLRTFVQSLLAEGVTLRSPQKDCLTNTVSFTVRGSDSIALLAGLDLEGVCASSGSACSAGSLEPSHVMTALGVDKEEANSLVRLSLGRESSAGELEQVEAILPKVI